ncbi:MAG: CrcB family protein [Phycisphaerae bacterium]|nr:CrcB family protein [Phycisphaerae bacterium]
MKSSGVPSDAVQPGATLWLGCLMIALGGGIGSVARAATLASIHEHVAYPPLFTVTGINLLGGALAGFLAERARRKGRLGSWPFALLVPGFCGGFTTFSSFAGQSSRLMDQGNWDTALYGIGAGVLLGLLAGRVGSMWVRT